MAGEISQSHLYAGRVRPLNWSACGMAAGGCGLPLCQAPRGRAAALPFLRFGSFSSFDNLEACRFWQNAVDKPGGKRVPLT
jgi:hypothetical protein